MGMSISKDTQELIVSALLKNSYLYNTSKSEMTDGYFSDPACKVIYKALTVYYGKYNTTPSLNEILITIEDCYLPMVGLSLEEVKTTCQKLYGYEEQSENFIKHSQELGIDCDSLTEMIDNSLVSEVDKRSGENRI